MLADIRYALRVLARSRGFSAAVILIIAVGIGANVALFTVVDALLLAPLPVPDPDRLVTFAHYMDGDAAASYSYAYPTFQRLQHDLEPVAAIAGVSVLDRSLDGESTTVALVSGNYFSTVGAAAAAGHGLTPDDDRVPGAHPIAAVSDAFARARFGAARDAVGRAMTFAGTTYTIVGVMAPAFRGDWIGRPVAIWIPMAMQSEVMRERPGLLANPGPGWVRVIARLKDGVSSTQAAAALRAATAQDVRRLVSKDRPMSPRELALIAQARDGIESIAHGFAPQRPQLLAPFRVLVGGVALVLVVACLNVASLQVVRAAARDRDTSIRLALGATGGRLAREQLIESLVFACIAGAGGVLIAMWTADALAAVVALGPILTVAGSVTTAIQVGLTWRAIVFAFAVSVAAGTLLGAAPALRAARTPAMGSLRQGGAAGRPRALLMNGLVAGQIALSLLLIVAGGLFFRTVRNLRTQDLGFDRDRVLLMWTAPERAGKRGAALVREFADMQSGIARLPGVVRVSVSTGGVLGGDESASPMTIAGRAFAADEDNWLRWNLVGPGFFDTVGMRLLAGRDFTAHDDAKAPKVAIVNETMARRFFAGEAVGRRFGLRRDAPDAIEIVGVVRDARVDSLKERPAPLAYLPYWQDIEHLGGLCVAVRVAGDAAAEALHMRAAARAIDPDLPIVAIDPIARQVDRSLFQERLLADLSSGFALAALLLTCVGLYGVVSYVGRRRTSEIGIRLAMGATRVDVMRLILRQGAATVAIGIVAGILMSLWAARLVASRLYGVASTDPLTIALAALTLAVVALIACAVPAHRASTIDPLTALRHE